MPCRNRSFQQYGIPVHRLEDKFFTFRGHQSRLPAIERQRLAFVAEHSRPALNAAEQRKSVVLTVAYLQSVPKLYALDGKLRQLEQHADLTLSRRFRHLAAICLIINKIQSVKTAKCGVEFFLGPFFSPAVQAEVERGGLRYFEQFELSDGGVDCAGRNMQ